MTSTTITTRRTLFTELFTEALQQQHCIIALHCNFNNIEAALQQHCNATTSTTTTTITTRRSVFTEALQQQHCRIALHCYCNNIEAVQAALQQHCDATPTTTTTTSTTDAREMIMHFGMIIKLWLQVLSYNLKRLFNVFWHIFVTKRKKSCSHSAIIILLSYHVTVDLLAWINWFTI